MAKDYKSHFANFGTENHYGFNAGNLSCNK